MPKEKHASWGSIVEESEYGTTPGTGEMYFNIVGDSMSEAIPLLAAKSLRGVSERHVFQGNKTTGGGITLETLFEGLGLFLKGLMGGYAFTTDTPVADAEQHVFSLADTVPSYSIEISKADVPAGDVFLYEGCVINSGTFNFSEEDILGLVVDIIAQEETADGVASGSPSFPVFNPILWHQTGGVVTLAGTADVPLVGGNLTINNNFTRRHLHNRTTRVPKRANRRVISGSIKTEFDDLVLYNKYKAGTYGTFSVTYTSEAYITGTTPWSIVIASPRVWLEGSTPPVDGEGVLEVDYTFRAVHDGTNEPLTVTIISGEASLA